MNITKEYIDRIEAEIKDRLTAKNETIKNLELKIQELNGEIKDRAAVEQDLLKEMIKIEEKLEKAKEFLKNL